MSCDYCKCELILHYFFRSNVELTFSLYFEIEGYFLLGYREQV